MSIVMMTKQRVWRSGPPPHVGWWQTSVKIDISQSYWPPTQDRAADYDGFGETTCWRWWDGEQWSIPTWKNSDPIRANCAAQHRWNGGEVFWNNYWPENARVPRVDPSKQIVAESELVGVVAPSAPRHTYYIDERGHIRDSSGQALSDTQVLSRLEHWRADRELATPKQIQKAQRLFSDDDIEIDDDARVSTSGDHVWVQAWVRISS